MTKSRWRRWITNIVLAGVAIFAAGLSVLSVQNPSGALLAMMHLVHSVVGNTRPPAIAADQLIGASWRTENETSRKLTAFFQMRFPSGASEDALRSVLLDNGFAPLPAPRADPFGDAKDRSKVLRYEWNPGGVCGDDITVRWTTDRPNMVMRVNARYHEACL